MQQANKWRKYKQQVYDVKARKKKNSMSIQRFHGLKYASHSKVS